jgi:SAM-dependent methyltransferase
MSSKPFFIQKLIEESGLANPRILELACGTARYMPEILKKYPGITYTGLEPLKSSYDEAVKNIGSLPQVTLCNRLGYGNLEGVPPESFDIVYSISALEHVKDLPAFIAMSGMYVKKGGLLVHRYDLGHALYPVSLKERFHAFLGNTLPALLPVDKFVRYVPEGEVVTLCTDVDCLPYKSTYHQMPNHKSLEKASVGNPQLTEAMAELYAWEWKYEKDFSGLPVRLREALFPAVAVWARKSQ